MPSPFKMLMRAGVAGVSGEFGEVVVGSGESERVESAGVEGYEERRVTVAVSALSWRVWARVRDPAVEGREDVGYEYCGRGGVHW